MNTNWYKQYKYRIFLILPLFEVEYSHLCNLSFQHHILSIAALWNHSLTPGPSLHIVGIFRICRWWFQPTQAYPLPLIHQSKLMHVYLHFNWINSDLEMCLWKYIKYWNIIYSIIRIVDNFIQWIKMALD